MCTFFQAQVVYYQRHQDYERCREALRIAEQGAEIGATGENKVEKRKRLEEEVVIFKFFREITQQFTMYETIFRLCKKP